MRKPKTSQSDSPNYELPEAGAASTQLQLFAQELWEQTAGKNGIDLTGYDAKASLVLRIAWAIGQGLAIGTVLTRFSTKMQGSTQDQLRVNVEFAARNRIYTPPEFLCVDEAVKGRKDDRPALQRCQLILQRRIATVLLIFKLSRLYRKAHQAKRFIEEEIVEAGLRAVAVSQNIDTADRKGWRLMVGLHGAMDEELLAAIGDHVREGQVGLFLRGWATGAIPLGYKAVVVPNAPLTRRGHPRTMPAVDESVAPLIREHFRLIAEGLSFRDGWRKWRRDGGPVDKRCKTGVMGYNAYLRMLSRANYIGLKEFCRKRNQWFSKADTIRQIAQPPEEVKVFRCEELRIVNDEVYWKVQTILKDKELGSRQRVLNRDHHLWDLTIGLFKCPHCRNACNQPQRFHMSGAKGQYMRCANPECPTPVMVHRQEAMVGICGELSKKLENDHALMDQVVASIPVLGSEDTDDLRRQVDAKQRQLRQLRQKIADIEELLGSGSDEDRTRRKASIRAAELERGGVELELLELQRRCGTSQHSGEPVTRERIVDAIGELLKLLDDAAMGRLGAEVVHKAVRVFGRLVGGGITVLAERRPGRKRWIVKARFTPHLLTTVRSDLGGVHGQTVAAPPVEVWLRKPPRVDELADEVHNIYENERIGFRLINQRLEKKYGKKIGSGNICAAWRRWYEVRALPLPPPRTNMGRPRRSA